MTVRSTGRKLSFEILSSLEDDSLPPIPRSSSDPISRNDSTESSSPKRRRHRKKKKHNNNNKVETIPENGDPQFTSVEDPSWASCDEGERSVFENRLNYFGGGGGGSTVVTQTIQHNGFSFGKLRQRNVNGSSIDSTNDERFSETMASEKENPPFEEVQNQFPRSETNGNVVVTRLDTESSLDWKQLMADDPDFLSAETRSPMKYFMGEIYGGVSLRSTTTSGNDVERERIYDMIFRLPWRCEVLLHTGFFVCVNSFLSLLTVMPIRVLLTFWGAFKKRQFRRPSSSELSDLACFLVLASGTILLGRTAQAITLSTCIVAHNNALLALLVSNNFAEIKSSVFKRFSKDNIHGLVYADAIERFHISAFLVSVLAQNILEAEGPWLGNFIYNATMVFFCEMMIDIIKHSFLAKFNGIRPIAYSEFLQALCEQTLNIRPEDRKTNLTFVPIAPACVVIRVLTPVYAAHVPCSPLPWRVMWMVFLFVITCIMLTSLKVLIGMGLRKHATWKEFAQEESGSTGLHSTQIQFTSFFLLIRFFPLYTFSHSLHRSATMSAAFIPMDQSQNNILMDSQPTTSSVKTVKISNVSLNVSKKELNEFFSFSGDIHYVEMRSETQETQLAYVTFKDPQGAETAMLLTGAVIADHRVSITPAVNYELPPEALALDSQEYSFNGFTVKKAEQVVSTMMERGYAVGKDAMEKAKAFDDKHNLVSNASATIASLDNKMGLSEKLSIGTTVVNEKLREVDERYQVREITKSALAAAEEKAISAGTALMANPYVSSGASWLSNAFGAVTKAVRAENGGEGRKEIVQLDDASPKAPAVVPVNSVDTDFTKPSF
uniref:RRM domain-containing protein n=1 Tax=Brassica campestris TaxID=3711 RepID=M4CJ86_BRACM